MNSQSITIHSIHDSNLPITLAQPVQSSLSELTAKLEGGRQSVALLPQIFIVPRCNVFD
jgi:hypothetical protein